MEGFYHKLDDLGTKLDGDLKYDQSFKTIYSTDASVYKEEPAAVVWPKNPSDIRKVMEFAVAEKSSITLRAGGTSLAGQVVTSGIIVDISRYMNRILEVNKEERWVRVEPGIVLDELNLHLKKFGLFFGPETSTSNRCNIGGMLGNNACGSHSIIYGSTRDHTIEVKTLLSDGSEALFGPLNKEEFAAKCNLSNLEGAIYRNIKEILDDKTNQEKIREGFPDPRVHRRNTGYAIDLLLESKVFTEGSDRKFNFSNLIAGSEGTLAAATEIKLNLIPLPPVNKALVCIHLSKRNDAFKANLVALKFKPGAVEMMDDKILELTKDNINQRKNRFFLEGDPAAILIVEFAREKPEEIDIAASGLIAAMKEAGFGYAYPVIKGKDISKVWDLRKAGLGVLANMEGDPKPVTLIEDTAVNVEVLPEYMAEIELILAKYGKSSVYHAHIGSGELHIRPILNLKDPADVKLFRSIGLDTAKLVKKFRGSLSGEHGDGRLRGEFIPIIIGEYNYGLLKKVKKAWDPEGILNPGKITGTPPMDTKLRYIPGEPTREIKTIYDFSSSGGVLRASEKCNGTADCRKSALIGGTMCPSYMATGDEYKTTRARANVLREYLNKGEDPWDHKEIYDVLDFCLGCKGCKAECPSNVDIAKIKSEFLQHWYDKHGISLRTRLIAYISVINKLGSFAPAVFNFFVKNKVTSGIVKSITGFAQERSIPSLYKTTLRKWTKKNLPKLNPANPIGKVCLFIDEFSDFNDTETGIDTVRLLTLLNYEVVTAGHKESARTFLSKGLVRTAQKKIRKNIEILSEIVSPEVPLLGIEPSAILGFRDEYPDLAGDLKGQADKIAANSFMIDEFIVREFKAGRIDRKLFVEDNANILLHAHCQQKAVASSASTLEMLAIPENYTVREIPSGCCGMAGSFGYEKEHFDLSVKVGELILFPEVRNAGSDTIISAPGTSCRHHIKDGTGTTALHPAVVLYRALKKK